MTVLQYLRMLARHWLALGLPVAAGLALAAGYLALTPPTYTATSQLFFSTPSPGNTSPQLLGGQLFLQSRMATYAALVSSPLVTQAAVRDLHQPFTAAQLRARTSVQAPEPTTLLNISVRDVDPRLASAAANALAVETGRTVGTLDSLLTSQAGSQRVGSSPVVARVTRTAATPSRPTWPQPWVMLSAAGLIGLIAGLIAAAWRHTRDATVRGRAGVLRATGLEPLAVIPRNEGSRSATQQESGLTGADARAEAVGVLRTTLQHGQLALRGQILAVTSARPGDGRTTVAVDLAHSLALTGSDVVLVEAQLDRPDVARLLRLGYGPGLANVLLGQFEPNEVLLQTRARALSVLPAGWSALETSGLLASSAMADVLAELRRSHHYVIVDTPAAATSAEAIDLLSMADAVLVVVQHDRTPGPAVAALMRRMRRIRIPIAGVVLTAAPTDAASNSSGAGGTGDPDEIGPGRTVTSARPAQSVSTDR